MEGQAGIGEMMRFSWAKSLGILFPFNFQKWFKILIIVWLAGVGVQGCSANFKAPARSGIRSSKVSAPKIPRVMPPRMVGRQDAVTSPEAEAPAVTPPVSGESPSGIQGTVPPSSSNDAERTAGLRAKARSSQSKTNPTIAAILMLGITVLGIGFLVFFMWLSSRFNFILFDSIVKGNTAIKAPFREHRETGNSYFKWGLAFLGISLAVLLGIGLIAAILLGISKGNAAIMALAILSSVLLGLAALLAMIVIGSVVRDFILPIMYSEKISTMAAIDRFMESQALSLGKVVQYLLIMLGLGILAAIVQGIAGVLVAIGGLIAGGIVALPGILLIKILPFLKLPLMILGILVAVAVILAVIVAIGMAMLPVVIFFRVFALAYLTRLYPECDLLGFNASR